MWSIVAPRPKRYVLKRDWTTCSIYDCHCRSNGQHKGGGDLYEHIISMRILTLIMNKIFIWAPEKSGSNHDLDLLRIPYLSCISYPRKSGLVKKSNHSGSLYLSALSTQLVLTIDIEVVSTIWADHPMSLLHISFLVFVLTRQGINARYCIECRLLEVKGFKRRKPRDRRLSRAVLWEGTKFSIPC